MLGLQKEEYRDTLEGKTYPVRLYPLYIGEKRKKINDAGYMAIDVQNRVNIEEIAMLRDRSFSMTLSRRQTVILKRFRRIGTDGFSPRIGAKRNQCLARKEERPADKRRTFGVCPHP